MFCVLLGRGLYDGPIRRPGCSVSMYDLRTWTRKRPRLEKGCCAQKKERKKEIPVHQFPSDDLIELQGLLACPECTVAHAVTTYVQG